MDIALVLGIYEMTAQNTPRVARVLSKHGLAILPEAHCYLRMGEKRIDLTGAVGQATGATAKLRFLYEEDIAPEQIVDYKVALHKKFLSTWMADNAGFGGRSPAEVWEVREECIASLSGQE